jgi:3',5'-cyclic AMP phosphodiesterase CpdA
MMVAIAVISDLHIGAKARRFDLQPGGKKGNGVLAYLDEFRKFVDANKLVADYLVVPGDIANVASPDEYSLAGAKMAEVAASLGVRPEHIIFVPGNHDVCWPVQRLGTDFWKAKKFLPIHEVLTESLGHDREAYRSLFEPPYALVRQSSELLVLLVNSAYKDDASDPNGGTSAPHHGSFAPESAEFLEAQLETIRAHKPAFTVLVTHHHILPIVDPDPYWEDFSMMNNSGLLLDFAGRAGVDLVIHGHKHWPRFQTYQQQPQSLFAVLSAGSFSAQIDESLSGRVFNKFHLIEMDGRDSSGNAVGKVRSWSYYSGHTWRPSQRENGISFCEPFGYYRTDEEILAQVRAAHAAASTGAFGPIDVDNVLNGVENCDYLAKDRLDAALSGVAKEAGLMLVTDTSSNRRYFING